MTRTGTSYFITFERARRYYEPYRPALSKEELTRWVAQKLVDKEIHLGEPPIRAGEYRRLDSDGRYEIVGP